jgi:hypothetical protein
MFWVIQETLYEAQDFEGLRHLLTVLDLPYVSVRVLRNGRLIEAGASANAPEPVIPTDCPIFVLGTYALSRVAQSRGWTPGALTLEGMDFGACRAGWGDAMLNARAVVGTVRDIAPPSDDCFARPYADSKAFNGQVFTPEAFATWRAQVLAQAPSAVLTPDTVIVVAPVQKIFSEHRFFVVGGRIVTGSLYRRAGQWVTSATVDEDARAFAENQVRRWRPADHFVIDVATVPDGHRIVEVNGLAMSGFYAANVGRLVMALEDFYAPVEREER